MKTTTLYRTEATETLTVSTVYVVDGKSRFYETAFVVKGKGVTDGERSAKKYEAGMTHDAAVAWAKGWERDKFSKRHERWEAGVKALVER